ncbi:hypothetical protein [Dokdonia sp. PRO95]|uniref:hypothetical protein n=1 Tax=Dokdonia sp. PRO95 TaxID=1239415 RepID=UPI00055088ED|nr:hypothetical protein [Dokdonia sp. PRO95]
MLDTIKMRKFYTTLLITSLIIGCSQDDINNEALEGEVEVEVEAQEEIINQPPDNFEVDIRDILHDGATINWSEALDPENDSVTYSVYLNQILVVENITDLTYHLNQLEELSTYSGKIIAKDTYNNLTEVNFSFQTEKYFLKYLKKYDYGEYSYGPNGYAYGSSNTLIKSNDQNYLISGTSVFPDGNGHRLSITKTDYEGNILWRKYYDYRLTDGWRPTIINSPTGIILASHHHVLSLDNEGNTIWYKKIDSYDISDGSADIRSVAQDSEGNIYIVGGRGSENPDIKQQAVLTKLNSSGEIQWEKIFESSRRNFFDDIVISNTNNLIILGSTETNGASSTHEEQIDFWVLKLTGEGEVIWENTFGDIRYDFTRKIIVKSNGNYVFAGHSWGAYDISEGRIFEINSEGTEIWNVSTELSSTFSIAETIDGGFITTGHVDFGDYGALGIYKFSSSGAEEWNKKYQESFTYLYGRSVLPEEDGGYRIIGSLGKNYYYNDDKPELLIYKTDPEGKYE